MARLRPDGEFEPPLSMTRRTALGAFGVGFALSMRPVSAETIITDTKGIVAKDVTIKVSDGEMPGYFAQPEGAGPFAGVLVVSEVFGLHEHIRDLVRRFAKQGYAAVAPNYFFRAGDPTKEPDFQKVFAIVGKETYALQMSDSQAGLDFLKAQPGVDKTKLGVTGFCWGGNVTWMITAQSPDIKAGAAWYGQLRKRASPGGPAGEDKPYPVDVAGKIKGRVIGFYAGKDGNITLDDVEAMRAALKAAGDTKSNIIVYPDAQHGFNGDYRPSYSEKDAKDAWAKMLAWFKDHGVA